MDPVSRRSFLVRGGAGLAGAAAVGGTGLVAVGAATAGAAPLSDEECAALDRPVLLSVRDAAAGEVELLVGEQEVTFTDRSLVAKVLRASRGA